MQALRKILPPLNSLVAFEAAARHLSFTRAGEELLVSREAVSRQIRNLESDLGVKLFARLHRALALTREGADFQAVVERSLGGIAQSAGALRRPGQPARVTITATIALASFWLTPRLPRFRARHPDVEVRVVVSDPPVDMAAEGIDAGLRYGGGEWSGLIATHLFDIESFPVCAPAYLDTGPPIETPADLAHHTLLNLDGLSHQAEDWSWWLAESGVRPPDPSHILGFDNYANVIQAALDRQGIALGFSHLLDRELSDGALVRPLDCVRSRGEAVYLVVSRSIMPSPSARKFCAWVLAEDAAQSHEAG